MRGQRVLHSSASDNWATPDDFYQLLDQEFHFTVDRAATRENKKCTLWYGPDSEVWPDALTCEWHGVGFLNPPYSQVSKFVYKAWMEALDRDTTTVCLIAARPDTRYWFNYVTCAEEIRFLKGRLKFGGAPNSAPFPSAVVIFGPHSSYLQKAKTRYWDWRQEVIHDRVQPKLSDRNDGTRLDRGHLHGGYDAGSCGGDSVE